MNAISESQSGIEGRRMGDAYERILCVKNEVFMYKIPPRQSSRGYRASDWKLDQPDWTVRLRIVELNTKCILKFEDKVTGQLFAQAPIDIYPGPSVESVSDSSRYFVIKIQEDGGRHAFIGMGFSDRGDSFDFNVTLQDHFKREKVEDEISKEEKNPQTHVDLRFKEGQTIKINLGNKSGESKPKPKLGGNIGFLPPPPGANTPKLVPPPVGGVPHARSSTAPTPAQNLFSSQPFTQEPQQQQQQQSNNDWGDFSTFSNSSSNPSATNGSSDSSGGNWVTF